MHPRLQISGILLDHMGDTPFVPESGPLPIQAYSQSTQQTLIPTTSPRTHKSNLPTGFLTLLLMLSLVTAMAIKYVHSGEMITLQVNGTVWHTRTHQRTVGAFLREVGLDLLATDSVVPGVDSPLQTQTNIVVQKALPVLIEADGQITEHYTHSQHLSDLLRETKLNPKSYDLLTLDGKIVTPDAMLPQPVWTPHRWPLLPNWATNSSRNASTAWIRFRLQRAVPLSINDNGTSTTLYTVAHTVGEALLDQDIVLYLGDHVQPLLGTLLTAGMHVEIHRAKPVTLQVDGKTIKTRTQASNVAQLLNEAGILLLNKDYTIPNLDSQIVQNQSVRIVRVVEDWVVETQDIPYETAWYADSQLELDQSRTDQSGKMGVRKCNLHIIYEDGVEKERTVADEWIERQPTTRVMFYGTKIVLRDLQTATGTVVRYWRKIRMLATSYHASGVGKSPSHPEYGLTRLGWRAQKGIVAVDPRVISLRSTVYVPGYGIGVAADTGGKIKGRWIDLCYDDDNYVPWKQWVDVYVLEPVPSTDQINWTLPSYPTEPH